MIYLGVDHRGFTLKEKIKTWLTEWGYTFEDCGNTVYDKEDDYPEYTLLVASKLKAQISNIKASSKFKEKERNQTKLANAGIVICGSGIGVSIGANRVAGIRCALGLSIDQIKHGRENDDINVLALACDYTKEEEMKKMIKVFLTTEFSGTERHKRRIGKIEAVLS